MLCLKPLLSNISSTSCQLLPDSHDSCTRTCICSLTKLQSRFDGGTIHRYILYRGLGPQSPDTLAAKLTIVVRGFGHRVRRPPLDSLLTTAQPTSRASVARQARSQTLWNECLSSVRRCSLDSPSGLPMVFPLPDLFAAWPLPFHLQACPSLGLSLFKPFTLQVLPSSGLCIFRSPSPYPAQSICSPIQSRMGERAFRKADSHLVKSACDKASLKICMMSLLSWTCSTTHSAAQYTDENSLAR